MKVCLITGFSGFVARYLVRQLVESGFVDKIVGVDLADPNILMEYDRVECEFIKLNLLDVNQVNLVVERVLPDYIIHLASFSSVAFSWNSPSESFLNNTNIFLNLIESVRKYRPNCRILSVGSSEEYGEISEDDIPVNESFDIRPMSPYAVARVSQELLSAVFVKGYNMDLVMTRSFNHIGPYQKDIFVIPGFVKQFAVAESRGLKHLNMYTGDISVIRDFTDVRDVVRGYEQLLRHGATGEVYNVCSGRGFRLKEIIKILSDLTNISVSIEINPEFVRPKENRIIIGDNRRIISECGWEPIIPIDESLRDILSFWRERV